MTEPAIQRITEPAERRQARERTLRFALGHIWRMAADFALIWLLLGAIVPGWENCGAMARLPVLALSFGALSALVHLALARLTVRRG